MDDISQWDTRERERCEWKTFKFCEFRGGVRHHLNHVKRIISYKRWNDETVHTYIYTSIHPYIHTSIHLYSDTTPIQQHLYLSRFSSKIVEYYSFCVEYYYALAFANRSRNFFVFLCSFFVRPPFLTIIIIINHTQHIKYQKSKNLYSDTTSIYLSILLQNRILFCVQITHLLLLIGHVIFSFFCVLFYWNIVRTSPHIGESCSRKIISKSIRMVSLPSKTWLHI